MRYRQTVATTIPVCAAAIVLIFMSASSPKVRASDDNEESRIARGFQIAPVPLNFAGKNRALVGLGSYIVNAGSDCNICHNSGAPPDFDFAPGANPYMLIPGTLIPQPKRLNPATYFGGGQVFGTADGGPPSPNDPLIISRNLTPDKTGRAEGGHTLAEFIRIIRTGADLDHLHPKLPAGFNGDVLQVMPWPTYQNMTDHDLEAIYEYLSAIPCLEGGPGEPPNRCH